MPNRLRPAHAPSGSPPRTRADGSCLPRHGRGAACDPTARFRASDGLRVWAPASEGTTRAPKARSQRPGRGGLPPMWLGEGLPGPFRDPAHLLETPLETA